MPITVDEALRGFLKKHVDAEATAKKQATDSTKTLRERFAAKCEEDDALPILYTDGFAFGSLERGTKQDPIDDSDHMCVMDGSGLWAHTGGSVWNVAGAGITSNPLGGSRYADENGCVSSTKVMAAFASTLKESYPRSEVRKDGQAVNVWLESYGFGIDLVPALLILTDKPHYFIPYGRGQNNWQPTNPRIDLAAYEIEDSRSGKLLRPGARLLRTWNEESNGSRLGGFLLDVLALRVSYAAGPQSSLAMFMAQVFLRAPGLLGSTVPQLTGFEPSVDAGLSDDARKKSIAAMDIAADIATKAVSAEAQGDHGLAIRYWAALLGDGLLEKVAA